MVNYSRTVALPALISGLILAPPLTAQVVYSESFRSPTMPGTDGITPCNTGAGGPGTYDFPVGWLLRNVDNGSPAAAVSYINEAWEVREDFGGGDNNNCVAFSTSWYVPSGTANDFMWSPQIAVPAGGANLSWRAKAYDPAYLDGYEVRVMPAAGGPPSGGTGVIGNQLSNSTVVFSTGGEQSTWITRNVDLTSFAGQNVHIGFRNTSFDKFVLVIDDVKVAGTAPDLAAQSPAAILPYTYVPSALVYAPMLGVSGSNVGASILTEVVASAQLIRDGLDEGAPIASSSSVASLAIGATAPVPFGAAPPTLSATGTWSVRYVVSPSQTEDPAVLGNNTVTSASVVVNATDLARHDGAPTSTLGIGAGNGGEIGVQFTLPNEATFSGVRFALAQKEAVVDDGNGGTRPSTWAGNPITANLRSYDTTNNRPGELIDTTVAGVTTFEGATYHLAFSGGPRLLAAGTYVVTVNEPIFAAFPADATMPLLMHADRFQAGTAWVNWPTSPSGNWANVESFGASFARTPAISLTTSLSLLKDGFETVVAPPDLAGNADGDATRRHGDALPQLSLARPKPR